MAKRWSVKNRKSRRDKARAYKEGQDPSFHKVAETRRRRALLRKANPSK